MKTLKRLVSSLLVFSMVLSMFLTVTATTNSTAEVAERTGITIDRVTSQNKFGESVTHAEGYYWTDKKLEEIPTTYEAWVYMPSSVTYPQEGNVILSTLPQVYASGTDNFFSFELKNGSEPKLMFGYNNKSVTEVVFWSEGRVPKDAWTHLVLVHDRINKTVSCYLNGELKETKEFTFVPDASNIDNPVALAGDRATANARAFTGILGDVAVYSDVRGAAEVRSDYNFGADTSDENLLLYYQISADKQGKDLEDLSGNGYDMNYNRVFFTEEEMQAIRDKDDKEYAYSIAFIPDIQILTDYFPNKLPPVFDYVLDSIEDKNIKYMVTLGDLTDENTEEEWALVKSQLDRFNGILPYSLIRGNHDGVWAGQAAIYDSIFADPDSDYYKHVQANGGFYDTSSVKNTYLLFEEGNTKYMILNLDYGITDEKILDWADEVIASHPDHRVIIVTHAWLGTTGEPFEPGEWSSPGTEVDGSIDPAIIWDEHFRKHANIDMIVCGHTHSDQIMCTPVVGDNGNVVYQVLIDSQFGDLAVNGGGKGLGGIGVVGIMYFTEDGQFAKIEYYSTIFERYYYEGHTDISLDFDAEGSVSYSIATDANGNRLNVKVVNGIEWVEENGELKMPAGPSSSFLLFDSELNANRIEATIVIRDNIGTDTNSHRNGLVFALTDHDEDLTFAYNGTDVSYYWAFVTDDDKVEVRKMGKYNGWSIIGPASATLTSLGIDVTKGVTLTAEWDNEGHIKVYANGILVQDITDTKGDPLTGSYYGMLVYKYGNSQGPDYKYPYDAPVTSFIAGKTMYDNCVDANGNPLNVNVVNGVTWIEKNGNLKMPAGPSSSFLLFDTPLEKNRIEATIIIRDNIHGDQNHRNGIVFALTDHDGDLNFSYTGTDVSYYWAYVNDWGCLAVWEMGANGNWGSAFSAGASVDLKATYGIDVTKGVTLAAEWDDAGHIKVYANDNLVFDVVDETPITGDLYGMLVYKYGNSQGPGYAHPYNAPVTSFIAGREITTEEPDEPVTPPTKPESYENCKDADGNLLTPVFVNDVIWVEENGAIKMPVGAHTSYLLFSDELATNRIEATILVRDNGVGGGGNHRNGLIFALTDDDGDHTFNSDRSDLSYYWAFINDWGCVEVVKMGNKGNWKWISTSAASLSALGIDVTEGVTLAAEWDDQGHIKVFANGYLVQDVTDTISEPLTGNLYGMFVEMWGNTLTPNTYNAPVTSFIAGGALETPDTKVSVTVDPTEAGTATGVGNYYLGASVTLTATPNPGYSFVGWYENGALASADATYTFVVTADRNLTATFTTTTYEITVDATAGGTVTGGGTVGEGAEVTVTATANAGYRFVAWLNGETEVSTNATYTFEATEDCALTAKFEKITYSIAVDGEGNVLSPYFVNGVTWVEENGKLKMPAGHTSSFLLFNNTLANNRIEATIYPNDLHGSADDRNGLVFALTDEDGDSSFSLGSTDASYYWVFITGWGSIEVAEMGKYQNWSWISKTQPTLASLGIDPAEGVTLAVEWDDEGHIRVFANDILVHNLVDATPLTGNLYGMLVRKWGNSGDPGTENYPYDAPVTSFVAGGESLWDKLEKHTIAVSTTPQWGGTVIGAGEYTLGGNATLTAVPKEGYVFEGWYENGELVSSSAAFAFTVEANRDLTAKFTAGYIYGDANGDAQINMKDLVLIRKYIANFDSDTNTSSVNVGVGADANGDGQINMEDVILIRKYIASYDYDAESETYALQDITDSLKLHGRTSVTSEGIVCDHSATGIEFSAYIEGTVELSVMASADTYFTVYIDGARQATRYNVKNGTATLTIANFMEGGVHNIRVLKQTESANSLSILKSISFKGQFEEAPAEKDLFIEFLGDSITCGYGNLCAHGAEGAGSAFNEDATQTYAYLAAQKLGADHSLVSCSGIGVTSSWSGNFVMKDFFSAQSYHRSTGVNYEKTFTPDIVVINLGTNDSSKGSDGAQFKEDAKALIALVRSTYGENVKIVWATNMMGACMQTYSEAAINELGGEAAGLYICTLTENREGGGAHPSNAAHASAAADLANFIQEKVLSK